MNTCTALMVRPKMLWIVGYGSLKDYEQNKNLVVQSQACSAGNKTRPARNRDTDTDRDLTKSCECRSGSKAARKHNTIEGGARRRPTKGQTMTEAEQKVQDLTDEVTAATTVETSATAFINGVPALIEAARQDAIGKGASEAQLTALASLGTTLKAQSDALSAALLANTPSATK